VRIGECNVNAVCGNGGWEEIIELIVPFYMSMWHGYGTVTL